MPLKKPNQVERFGFFFASWEQLISKCAPNQASKAERSHIPSLGVSADLETGVILPGGVRS